MKVSLSSVQEKNCFNLGFKSNVLKKMCQFDFEPKVIIFFLHDLLLSNTLIFTHVSNPK